MKVQMWNLREILAQGLNNGTDIVRVEKSRSNALGGPDWMAADLGHLNVHIEDHRFGLTILAALDEFGEVDVLCFYLECKISRLRDPKIICANGITIGIKKNNFH